MDDPIPMGSRLALAADGVLRELVSATQADALARHVLADERNEVVVVVASTGRRQFFDENALTAELVGIAPVVLLLGEDAMAAFAAAMPPGFAVFADTARIFPPGSHWRSDPRLTPVSLALHPSERSRATAAVISHAMIAARAVGVLEAPVTAMVVVAVVERMLSQHRALCRLPDDRACIVISDTIVAGLPVNRLLGVGQRLRGRLVDRPGTLPLLVPIQDEDEVRVRLLASYEPGSLVLGLVSEVSDRRVRVLLHPSFGVDVPLAAKSASAADVLEATGALDVREVVDVGDIVWLSVRTHDPFGVDLVAHRGVPLVAASMLPGGPPWLRPDDVWLRPPVDPHASVPNSSVSSVPEEVAAVLRLVGPDATPSPHRAPPVPGRIGSLEREYLVAELVRLRARAADSERQLRALRRRLRE